MRWQPGAVVGPIILTAWLCVANAAAAEPGKDREAAPAGCPDVSGKSPALNRDLLRMPWVRVRRSRLYPLIPGQAVFEDREFVWRQLSPELEGQPAVRSRLEGLEPRHVTLTGPGRLLALLWIWDFGFMRDGPQNAVNVNGWRLLDPKAAQVEGYPHPLGLYCQQVPAGKVTVDLRAYFGQWIIVGFEHGVQAGDESTSPLPLELSGAKTRHNILDPGEEATLRLVPGATLDDRAAVVCELFDEGERLSCFEGTGRALRTEGISFALPDRPGRYWLQVGVRGGSTKTVLPLTVALPAIERYASMEKTFPVNTWVRCAGTPETLICPDGEVLRELELIDQVELGVNTFFAGNDEPVLEALNGRKIASAGNTKYAVRTVGPDNPEGAAKTVMGQLGQAGPFGRDVIAIYAADEPPLDNPELFRILEELYQEQGAAYMAEERPLPPLLYCLCSYGERSAIEFWQAANSGVRMVRFYPVLGRGRHGRSLAPVAHFMSWVERYQGYGADHQDTPLWLVMQTFGQDLLWSPPTGGQVRLMANLALARGTKALSYYGYGTNRYGEGIVNYPFLPKDDRYQAVKALGKKLVGLTEVLPQLKWIGGIEQKDALFDVQYLADTKGTDYIWITNWDYSAPHAGLAVVGPVMLQETGTYKEIAGEGTVLMALPQGETITVGESSRLAISLEPGAGQLLKVVGQSLGG